MGMFDDLEKETREFDKKLRDGAKQWDREVWQGKQDTETEDEEDDNEEDDDSDDD